jgi:aldose 1-epimerase
VIGADTIAGFRVVTIASNALTAAFAPGAGMVCCSLTDHGEGVLGLRNGLRAYAGERSTMGIPLLYPWANRLARPRLELAGRRFDVSESEPGPKLDANGLPIHGLLTGAPGWVVERTAERPDGGSISARFRFDGAIARGFPFRHSILLVATLSGGSLGIELTVEADADDRVPIAFGFHPYFVLPGVPREKWRLTVPVGTGLVLDDLGLPTGERRSVGAIGGELGERTFDDAFLAPGAGEPFILSGGGRRIEVEFARGYPFAQLYAPPGEDLLAWEPMTAPTNALVSGDELRFIEPGGSYSASFSVTVGPE